MATTVSYSASMRTRKTSSSSNAKSSAASQEYYENTYNYVGIVHFAGMALSGKVITGISLRICSAVRAIWATASPVASKASSFAASTTSRRDSLLEALKKVMDPDIARKEVARNNEMLQLFSLDEAVAAMKRVYIELMNDNA